MIVSASYKTDIPAFYGRWFWNRLEAGYCLVANPYNRSQRFAVSLRREDVDGFVFWTKNVAPFMGILDEVHELGYAFIVHYTINGYPRALESRVVDATRSVTSFRAIANKYGARTAIWRYDTIILSSLTDANFHRQNFASLAKELSGSTDEVVVSFMQVYGKTRSNMDQAAKSHGFQWEDPSPEHKRELLTDLQEIAEHYKMQLTICTQPDLLIAGSAEARCIDAQRLMDVSGRPFNASVKGMRTGCGCFEAKDIGDYDTCPHGCVYCYAVRNRPLALRRYQQHDPNGEYLFPQKALSSDGGVEHADQQKQLPLFPDLRDHQS